MKRAAVVSLLAVMLTGCGHSMPTRFFTLDPVAPAAGPSTNTAVLPVQLQAVRIPEVIDRPEMVSQSAANELRISDFDHWGAPLGGLMRRTLAQDLLARLPQGAFVLPGAPEGPDMRGLVVDVLAFQADASGHVMLQASWTLSSGKPAHASTTRDVQLQTMATAGDASSQAAAMSRLLGQLADQIAATIAQG